MGRYKNWTRAPGPQNIYIARVTRWKICDHLSRSIVIIRKLFFKINFTTSKNNKVFYPDCVKSDTWTCIVILRLSREVIDEMKRRGEETQKSRQLHVKLCLSQRHLLFLLLLPLLIDSWHNLIVLLKNKNLSSTKSIIRRPNPHIIHRQWCDCCWLLLLYRWWIFYYFSFFPTQSQQQCYYGQGEYVPITTSILLFHELMLFVAHHWW